MRGNILTTDQVLAMISKRGMKYIFIYEGFLTSTDGVPHFDRLKTKTADELVQEMDDFAKTFPGQYTLLMRQNENGQETNLSKLKWDTYKTDAVEVEAEEVPPMQGQHMTEEKITELYQKWQTEKEEKQEIEDLKDELKEMKTNGGKFAYVGLQMLQMLKPGMFPQGQVMQGVEVDNSTPPVINNPEELKKALNRLVQVAGEADIIAIANKITPAQVQQLKAFIN